MAIKRTGVQGEGNYTAAKEYNDATRKFVQSGRVAAAARHAAPKSAADAVEMERAEKAVLLHVRNTQTGPGTGPTPHGPDPEDPPGEPPMEDPKPDPVEKKKFQRIRQS